MGNYVDDDGRVSFRNVNSNDTRSNGFQTNGFRSNGFRSNGFRSNGFRSNGFRSNGDALSNVLMQGNRLTAKNPSNQTLEGAALEDVRVDVDFEDPVTHQLTVYEYSITEIEEAANDLILQTIKFRQLPSGAWTNTCENGAKAVQLKGDWDLTTVDRITTNPDAITMACLGAALGDCAVWGYVPGKTVSSTALDDFHQTCLRLKRADYCGNGVHHTQNGHPIDVYDKLNVMTPEVGLNWNIEGMWNEYGAVCLNHTRKTNYSKLTNESGKTYIGCNIPACVDVNSDGVINFADYPTARMANKSVPADPT